MPTTTPTELHTTFDEKDIFDQIFSIIESKHINPIYNEVLASLERLVQDIDDEDLSNKVKEILNTIFLPLNEIVLNFIPDKDQGTSIIEMDVFFSKIALLDKIIRIGNKCKSTKDIIKDIDFIFISLIAINDINIRTRTMSGTTKKLKEIKIKNIQGAQSLIWHDKPLNMNAVITRNIKSQKKDYYDELNWVIDISFQGSDINNASYLFWVFSGITESIEGVSLELESLRNGSIFAKFKIKFQSPFARDEFAQILDNVQHGFTDTSTLIGEGIENKYHTKPIAETNKINNESEKIREEAEKTRFEKEEIKRRLDANLDADIEKELTLRERYAELNAKELENQRKMIENHSLVLDLKTKMSDMLRDGILMQDDVKIEINNLLLIYKEDHKISNGVPMREIIEKSKKSQDDKELPIDQQI